MSNYQFYTLVSTTAANAFVRVITGPLDRVKHIRQIKSSLIDESNDDEAATALMRQRHSILDDLKAIVESQGLLALWNGTCLAVIHSIPNSILRLFFSRFFSARLLPRYSMSMFETKLRISATIMLSAGITTALIYPIQMLMDRQMANVTISKSSNTQKSLLQDVRDIVKSEGILGLFKGLSLHLVATVPATTLSYFLGIYLRSYNTTSNHLTRLLYDAAINGFSTSITQLIFYPLAVVRQRMISGTPGTRNNKSTKQHFIQLRNEGINGFYAGAGVQIPLPIINNFVHLHAQHAIAMALNTFK